MKKMEMTNASINIANVPAGIVDATTTKASYPPTPRVRNEFAEKVGKARLDREDGSGQNNRVRTQTLENSTKDR